MSPQRCSGWDFETIVGLDLDKADMEEKSIAFARVVRDADVALVYYSGHAMQRHGMNYLMPVDAVLHDDADLRRLTRVEVRPRISASSCSTLVE
jgi:uncharacterized caspase-like protein